MIPRLPGLSTPGVLGLAALVLCAATTLAGSPAARPNVVFILADDIGPGDLGVYHRERTGKDPVIPTPHLDRLAAEGMRFRDAHTPAALCAPTRYSVMTGNYPYRCRKPWGVWSAFEASAVGPGEGTVAQVMQAAGYRTAFFGKWNIGGSWEKLAPPGRYKGSELWDDGFDYAQIVDGDPNRLGFDYSLQLPNGIQANPAAFYQNGRWLPLGADSEIEVWSKLRDQATAHFRHDYIKGDSRWETSIVGHKLALGAAAFIERRHAKSPDQPFFIYYCSQAVHGPRVPPETFEGEPVKGTTISTLGDMIKELDLQVGMIVEALKDAGVYDQTLILFTSDNGGLRDRRNREHGHLSSNGFRGSKGVIYEGGHRVPFVARWPGVVPAGAVSDAPIMAQDLMATLYALTDQAMPADQGLDSFNLLPVLRGDPGARGRDRMCLQGGIRRNLDVALRQGDWKLLIHSDSEGSIGESFGLFNVSENPTEEEAGNRISDPDQQTRIAAMRKTYLQLRRSGARSTEPVPADGGKGAPTQNPAAPLQDAMLR